MQKSFIFRLALSIRDLVYPPQCLYCRFSLTKGHLLLCAPCLDLLEVLRIDDKCPRCFSSEYALSSRLCAHCSKEQSLFNGMAAVFDYVGPAAILVKKCKYGDKPYLANVLGSYLALQFFHMNWPLPDVVIPTPISLLRRMERGYNQSELLAKHLSSLLNVPFDNALKKKNGDFSQAGLSQIQRKQLPENRFSLKSHYPIEDKTILLIDDVMTTGSTLKRCAEALIKGYPRAIYALTVCRTAS